MNQFKQIVSIKKLGRIVFLFLIICAGQSSLLLSQNALDSIMTKVEQEKGVLGKMELLDDLSWSYRKQYPQGAVLLAFKGLSLANQQNDSAFLQKFYSRLGSAYFHFTKLDSAQYFTKKSLQIAQNRKDLNAIAGNYYNLSQYLNYQGKYPPALSAIYNSLEAYTQIGNPSSSPWLIKDWEKYRPVQDTFRKQLKHSKKP